MIGNGGPLEKWQKVSDWWKLESIPTDLYLLGRPGAIIRVRLPAAEQIRKGWAEWSAYGTTY